MKVRYVVLLAMVALSVTGPIGLVSGQIATAPIHVLGFSWGNSLQIPMYIQPAPQQWQNQTVYKAMDIWYNAQTWFVNTYEKGSGPVYQFVVTNNKTAAAQNGEILTWNKTGNYGRLSILWGNTNWTYNYWPSNNQIYQIQIGISIALESQGFSLDQSDVEAIVVHELGHALGLADLKNPYSMENDLMNTAAPGRTIILPSTVDLYAIYQLGKIGIQNNNDWTKYPATISLPNSIPYYVVTQKQIAIPEFNNELVIFAVSVFVGLIVKMRN